MDPDPDLDLQKKRIPDLYKKRILYQNSLYELKTFFDKFEGADFEYDNNVLKLLPKIT